MKSVLFTDIKSFIKYVQKKSYVLQIITLIVLILICYRQEVIYTNILKNLSEIEKKVDYRYFNLTRSLEDISNSEIDTYKGRVIRQIKANQ